MLLKESKIRVLENFYALDYVFFGKPITKVESCCPLVKEEYMSIKGALLSVFVEMLKLVDHNPESVEEQVDSKELMKSARNSAKIARENAEKIVSTDKSRANIKESLKEKIKEDNSIDISLAIEEQIRQKAFSFAVDNLLLARVVAESLTFDKLNTWEGTIIEDSYKILRDNLIESAYEILDEEILDEDKEELEERRIAGFLVGAIAGFLTPIPFGALVGGLAGGITAQKVWKMKNDKKLRQYCKTNIKGKGVSYEDCVALGHKVMNAKLKKAKAEAKAKAKAKTKGKVNEAEEPINN